MTDEKRPLKVFLCHASQDKPVVRELSKRLVAEGWIDTWLDELKLLPGQDWRLHIEEAVETSDIVIICLSNNSVTKEGHVQKELRYAREIALEKPEETIFLIPLRLDECDTPRGLRFYQWADYFGERKEETFNTLLQSLKLRYEQKLRIEAEESARRDKEKAERESIEKAVRERVEREAAEKSELKKAEREVKEKTAREKAERDAAEKAARKMAEREAKGKNAKAQNMNLGGNSAIPENENLLSHQRSMKSFIFPTVLGLSFLSLIIYYFLLSGTALKEIQSKPTSTVSQVVKEVTLTQQAGTPMWTASPTNNVIISQTQSPIPNINSTPTSTEKPIFTVEHLETITLENLPRLTRIAQFTYNGNFLGLSPSGKMVITDAGFIYALETQEVICNVSMKLDQDQGDEFALSDNYVVIYNHTTHQIKVWNLQGCRDKVIDVPSIRTVGDIAIAPNNIDTLIQALNNDSRHVLINLNLNSGEQKKRITLGSAMSNIEFSSDGATFAASSGGGFAQIYSFPDFAVISKFAASNMWAHIISYQPEKDILITSDEYPTSNTNIRIWKISQGKTIYKISDSKKLSDGKLGLSPDGYLLASSKEKMLSLWQVNSEMMPYNLDLGKLIFGSVFSHNQKILIVLIDGNRIMIYGVIPDL